MVLLDAPRTLPFGQDKPGISHTTDGLIGTMTHHNPYIQPPTIYVAPQYLQLYGVPSYYPPPPYQHPYHVTPPPTHELALTGTHDVSDLSTKLEYTFYLSI
jgi:hypothetical protein